MTTSLDSGTRSRLVELIQGYRITQVLYAAASLGIAGLIAKRSGTGMGSVYRRGSVWWIKYYISGRPVRETTGTEHEPEARRILKGKEGRVAAGMPVLPRADRVRYEQASGDLRAHYQATGCRDLAEAEFRLAHLDRFFRGRRLADVGPADATRYVLERQAAGAANGTINRELATLSRMLRLAYENSKLLRIPVLKRLKEAAPRQGFFERDQFEAVRRHLAPDLQVLVSLAYAYGWRMGDELLSLERRQLDLTAGTLRLDGGATKNDDGRVVYLTPELKTLLAAQLERVEALGRRRGAIIPSLFPHLRGRRAGQPRGEFRKAWRTACREAGVAGRIPHDFRRTAVRNMVNAGVPERVAMQVTGHRTRAVFDRYHIVSPADLQEVARKLAGTI